MLAITATKTKAGQSPVHIFFNDFTEVRTLIAESLAGVESGRLPGDLGDTAEALDTGRVAPLGCWGMLPCMSSACFEG